MAGIKGGKFKQLTQEDLKRLFIWRHERPGDVFMDILKRDGLIVAPGVYDAMGGYIAKEIYQKKKDSGLPCAFNAVYEGHWSTNAMLIRRPDMGFGDFNFLSLVGQYTVAAAYPLPVIFDIETGFGNATTITKTIQKCDEIGVAVVHLEDQEDNYQESGGVSVRRCGNQGGKLCTPTPNMLAKIKACLTVIKALDSSVCLMVRTDALNAVGGGIEEAIERGKKYMSVDIQGWRPTILWADAMYNPKDIEYWIKEFRKFDPDIVLGFNYSPNRDWTPVTYGQKFGCAPPTYQDLYRGGEGFSVIWHTIIQSRADMESSWNVINDMAGMGAWALWNLHERQRNHPVGDSQAMSGVHEWQSFEQYIGGQSVIDRYSQSEGYKGSEKDIKQFKS